MDLPFRIDVELRVRPTPSRFDSVLADSANRQDGLSGIDAEDPQRPAFKGFTREIELLTERKRVVQGNSPGIHTRLHVHSSDHSSVLSARVVAAESNGIIAVVDMGRQTQPRFRSRRPAALADPRRSPARTSGCRIVAPIRIDSGELETGLGTI